ncbi:hypothetical protein MSIM_36540 [Mycobacterium simiae]|nr:hypothetical protein MSIM_36540 [Mycobacterium simiae]
MGADRIAEAPKHYKPGALSWHEAVGVTVEWSRSSRRAQGSHSGEPVRNQQGISTIDTTSQHHIRCMVMQTIARQLDRVER